MQWMNFGGAGWFITTVILGLIIVGIFPFLFWFSKHNSEPTKENTPLEIIKKRYARGEINKDEFREMKKTLKDLDDLL